MHDIRETSTDASLSVRLEKDRQEFLILLVSLLPLQVIYPVLSGGASERPAMIIFFSFFLFAGVWLMRGSRHRFLMSAILTLVSLELIWMSLWPAASSLIFFGELCLLLLMIMVTGRAVSTYIRTALPVPDLLLGAATLFLLAGTILGIGLYLISGFSPAGAGLNLAVSLSNGLSLVTTSGAVYPMTDQEPALIRVVSTLGMIMGVLLLALVIGKIGAALVQKGYGS